MVQQVQFVQLTQAEYDALTTKDSGRLYFTSDTKRIYKGPDLFAATIFDQQIANSIEASELTVNGDNVSLEGHTHTFGDVTGLSDVLSGITSTSISKSSVVANTVSASSGAFSSGLTVAGSSVSLDGHTHLVVDIQDYEVQIRYSLNTASTSTSGTTQTVVLVDRANNSVAQGSGITTVALAFPTATSGRARDFILAITCGSTPPNVVFPAGVTIVVDDYTDLTAEEGLNLYSFTEISAGTFVVSRLLVAAYSAQ